MKNINRYIVAVMIACTLLSGPKVTAWWNLIYSVDCEDKDNEDREIRFFFIDWINSLRTCKKR